MAAVQKFSNQQWNALKATLTPEQIRTFEVQGLVPGRQGISPNSDRSTKEDQIDAMRKILDGATKDEDGSYKINVCTFLDTEQFPESARFATFWSQLAPGSEVAHELGWKSSLSTIRRMVKGKKADSFDLIVTLIPETDEHRTKRTEALNKKKKGSRTTMEIPSNPRDVTVKPRNDDSLPPDAGDNDSEE